MRTFITYLPFLLNHAAYMIAEAEYYKPTDVESACQLLADHDEAIVVAGGQSLSLLTKEGIISPEKLVDINHVDGLDGIDENNDVLQIGATTTHRTIETSSLVEEAIPALATSAGQIADVQIRNAGTIGGVAAYADPTADYPPVFLVLNATIHAETVDAENEYSADEFFTGYYQSALDEQELVTEVRIPIPSENEGTAFEKLAFRENDRAIVNTAAWVAVEDGTCTNARVAVGGTTNMPLLATDAATHLEGTALDDSDIEAAAIAAKEEIRIASDPSIDEAYRKDMVENKVKKALKTADERARGEQ